MIFEQQKKIKNMKKIFLSLCLIATAISGFAVSEGYEAAMKGLLTKLNSANSIEAVDAASNGFVRIAEAEKTEWLPYYYAAYGNLLKVYMLKAEDKEQIDRILGVVDKHIMAIEQINTNDEVLCLKSWANSARIMVDPMTRGQKYGAEAAKYLQRAKTLNPNNPRVSFLEGQSAYYTPEAFGGGKQKALALFTEAEALFKKFEPSSDIMPNWGREQNRNMLNICSTK